MCIVDSNMDRRNIPNQSTLCTLVERILEYYKPLHGSWGQPLGYSEVPLTHSKIRDDDDGEC